VGLQVTAIMLGVADLARAKAFYADGLGATVDQDYPNFVSLTLDAGSSLALYERSAAAADAGVPAEGSGFAGVSFQYIVGSNDEVDDFMARAAAAGATTVRPAEKVQWGHFGYVADPDGHLWKVAAG
jgi:catechol 2,3-dioxygenase-like lactoylglutathione lyase family enzyme